MPRAWSVPPAAAAAQPSLCGRRAAVQPWLVHEVVVSPEEAVRSAAAELKPQNSWARFVMIRAAPWVAKLVEKSCPMSRGAAEKIPEAGWNSVMLLVVVQDGERDLNHGGGSPV